MKVKIIILTAAVSALLFSCTTDREEPQERANSSVEAKKLIVEPTMGTQDKTEGVAVSDTLRLTTPADATGGGTGLPPENPDPDGPEIVHPGDVKPPKGG